MNVYEFWAAVGFMCLLGVLGAVQWRNQEVTLAKYLLIVLGYMVVGFWAGYLGAHFRLMEYKFLKDFQ